MIVPRTAKVLAWSHGMTENFRKPYSKVNLLLQKDAKSKPITYMDTFDTTSIGLVK